MKNIWFEKWQDNLRKKASKLSTAELKQLLSAETINKFFEGNQKLKNTFLQAGASNMLLTFNEKQLQDKQIDALSHDRYLREETLRTAYTADLSEKQINKKLEKYANTIKNPGEKEEFNKKSFDEKILIAANATYKVTNSQKIKEDKIPEVSATVEKLKKKNGLYAAAMYRKITSKVSYQSSISASEQAKYFGEKRQIPKNIAQAVYSNESVVFKPDEKFKKVVRGTSGIVGDPTKQVITEAEAKVNEKLQQKINEMIDKMTKLATTKVAGKDGKKTALSRQEFNEQASQILGKYYNEIINSSSEDLRKILGTDIKNESVAIQKREIIKTLNDMYSKTLQKMDSTSKYLPVDDKLRMEMDQKFGKMTGEFDKAFKNIDIDNLKQLSTKKRDDVPIEDANIRRVMNENANFKSMYENFEEKSKRYNQIKSELDANMKKLEELKKANISKQNNKAIQDTEKQIEDEKIRLSVLGPILDKTKAQIEEFAKSYAYAPKPPAKGTSTQPQAQPQASTNGAQTQSQTSAQKPAQTSTQTKGTQAQPQTQASAQTNGTPPPTGAHRRNDSELSKEMQKDIDKQVRKVFDRLLRYRLYREIDLKIKTENLKTKESLRTEILGMINTINNKLRILKEQGKENTKEFKELNSALAEVQTIAKNNGIRIRATKARKSITYFNSGTGNGNRA